MANRQWSDAEILDVLDELADTAAVLDAGAMGEQAKSVESARELIVHLLRLMPYRGGE